jgi:hypothetical protein
MSGKPPKRKRLAKWSLLIAVNLLVFLFLFSIAEISYRVYREGFPRAFTGLTHDLVGVPYSNLGTSNWVIYDEELGYRLNPDRERFNNRSVRHGEITVPKPKEVYRIMFLGDSIPWDSDGFVKYTRASLEPTGPFEVINASVPGYTSYQEVLFYKKYLKDTTPDLVVWLYCLNDNHRFLHRFDENARMLWTREAERSLEVDSVWDSVISRSYLLTRLRLGILHEMEQRRAKSKGRFSWESTVDFHIAWKDAPWLDYEDYLLDLMGMLDEHNGKLAIIVFPLESQLRYGNNRGDYDYVVKPQRKLLALCKKHGIPCLDLYPEFEGQYSGKKGLFRKKRLFRDGIHLNEEGHRFVTGQTLRFLSENQLLPPNRRPGD